MADDEERYGEPTYLALAAELRRGIEDGTYPAGSVLPSITRLSQERGIAKTTVAKSYRVLKAEGIVRGVQGWGYISQPREG